MTYENRRDLWNVLYIVLMLICTCLIIFSGCSNKNKLASHDTAYALSDTAVLDIRLNGRVIFDFSDTVRFVDTTYLVETPYGYFDMKVFFADCISNGEINYSVILQKHDFEMYLDSLQIHEVDSLVP